MGTLLKNNKLLGGLGIIVLLSVVGYYMWGGSSSAPAIVVDQGSPASQELLLTLGNLRTITLDPSILTDQKFTALSDFGVTIPPQPTGRRNPFAPVGGFATAPSAAQ